MKLNKKQIKRIARKKKRKHVIDQISRIKSLIKDAAKNGNRTARVYNHYPFMVSREEAGNNVDIAVRFITIKYNLKSERMTNWFAPRYEIYLY